MVGFVFLSFLRGVVCACVCLGVGVGMADLVACRRMLHFKKKKMLVRLFCVVLFACSLLFYSFVCRWVFLDLFRLFLVGFFFSHFGFF